MNVIENYVRFRFSICLARSMVCMIIHMIRLLTDGILEYNKKIGGTIMKREKLQVHGEPTCSSCGGHLEILDEVTNHLCCDTCGYEEDLLGVINPGAYVDDEFDPLADNIMKEHECGNGIDTSILEESKVEPCSQDCKECDETCYGKLAICFDDSSCMDGHTDHSHCDNCFKHQVTEHPELNCWDVNDCTKCDSVKCARSPHFESPKCSIDGRLCNKESCEGCSLICKGCGYPEGDCRCGNTVYETSHDYYNR
jgi:hypothetical protein